MGCSYEFKCNDCGLTAEVSGGPDSGFYIETRTFWCSKCESLQDVTVKKDQSDSPYPPLTPQFTAVTPTCHQCNSHGLSEWRSGQPCPKCGGSVSQSEDITVFWD